MSTDNPTTDEEKWPIGSLLSSAREKAGLSISDVASRLNLYEELIKAIEADQFPEDLSPAFYRGYLRSYAHIVNEDADILIKHYNKTINQGSLTSHIIPTFEQNLATDLSLKKSHWLKTALVSISLLTIVTLAVLLVQKLSNDSSTTPEIALNVQSDSSTSEPQSDNQIPLSINSSATDNAKNQEQNPRENSSQGNVQKEPQPAPEMVEQNLNLAFRGDCWVKVVDASGNELAFGIKKSGKTMNLSGIAPFNVILGDPSVVSMNIDGKDVDLSGYTPGKRVILTIDSKR